MASNLGAKLKLFEGIICHKKPQAQNRAAAKCEYLEEISRENVGHKYLSHLLLLGRHRRLQEHNADTLKAQWRRLEDSDKQYQDRGGSLVEGPRSLTSLFSKAPP